MSKADIAHALQSVYDPELGIDVVSMGLLYGIDDEGEQVTVRMTTTFPGCPMGGSIAQAVERAVRQARPDAEVAVETTHEPPWDPGMLTPKARQWLGME